MNMGIIVIWDFLPQTRVNLLGLMWMNVISAGCGSLSWWQWVHSCWQAGRARHRLL